MEAREALATALATSKWRWLGWTDDETADLGRRWNAFVGVADTLQARLADSGYVLVNVAELRATIAAWRDPGDTPYEAGWNRAIDAVLALLDDAHPA